MYKLNKILLEMNVIESVDQIDEKFFQWRSEIAKYIEEEDQYFGVKKWVKEDIVGASKELSLTLTDEEIDDIIVNVDDKLGEVNEYDWIIIDNEIQKLAEIN